VDQAMNEDARRMDFVGIKLARLDDFFYFGDSDLAARRGVRVEVARGTAIDEVSIEVSLPCLHESQISYDAAFQDVGFAVEFLVLLALGNDGAGSRSSIEAGNACSAGTHALRQCPLWAELDFNFAGKKLPFELGILSDVAGDHLPDLVRSQKEAESRTINSRVVARDGEIANARIA